MIVRGPRPSDNFAQIHNAALADGRLSFKARGILAFLLSRPPGWKTSAERLAKSGTDGERAVKSGLKELEELGYLQRTRGHAEDGTWVHNQVVTDQPAELASDPGLDTMGAKQPDGEKEDTDLDTTGTFCTGGKQPDINNTSPNNNYLGEGDVVSSPTEGGATTATSRISTEGREGVGTPTPLNPKPNKRWLTEPAWRTAHEQIELQDIMLSITKYEIRMKELNRDPKASEWLRWLIEDEQKLRTEERKQAQENGRKKPWYAVAGD